MGSGCIQHRTSGNIRYQNVMGRLNLSEVKPLYKIRDLCSMTALVEWLEESEGVPRAEVKQVTEMLQSKEDRYVDISKYMALLRGESRVTNSYQFGKFAALCGERGLLQTFMDGRKVLMPKPFFDCLEGACICGDFGCLELCLQRWEHSKHRMSHEKKLDTTMGVLSYICERFQLEKTAGSTFRWISSRWSNVVILECIEDLVKKNFRRVLLSLGKLPLCCNSTPPSNASLLMSYFSAVGSLEGFKWLHSMGVTSKNALLIGILNNRPEIPDYLLSNHEVSMCTKSQMFILTHCSNATLVWCLRKSLCLCWYALIYMCIEQDNVMKLLMLVENGGLVTQSHVDLAIKLNRFECIAVLCGALKKWNPNHDETLLETSHRMRAQHTSVSHGLPEHQVPPVASVVINWCRHENVPVQSWSSKNSVQQVGYQGEVDQAGVLCSSASKLHMVWREDLFHRKVQCSCAPP